MTKYTFIKAHLVEVSDFAKSEGYHKGSMIGSYIYKTDSHALALHQCRKDYPKWGNKVCLEAVTIDIDDEQYKDLYRAHEECGCVMDVYGW